MKTIKYIALACMVLFAGISISNAQTGIHKHNAPHRELLQEAGGYHNEMVKVATNINFYVPDAKEKTVSNKKITGTHILLNPFEI